jgi:hypothetical protein
VLTADVADLLENFAGEILGSAIDDAAALAHPIHHMAEIR